LCRGIEIEHGRTRHVALFEADALAVLEVDGGEEDHAKISREGSSAPIVLIPPPPRRLRRRPSPPRARARGGRVIDAMAWRKLTASISESSKSGPAQSAGSSPGETGCRWRCPCRRWP